MSFHLQPEPIEAQPSAPSRFPPSGICIVGLIPLMLLDRAWLLSCFKFSPSAVFLLFGANGVLAELIIGGPALLMAPFWIFVYGLMIFLPSFSFVHPPGAVAPRWFHYPAAIGGCLLASATVAVVVNLLAPHLPHFGATLTFPKDLIR